MSRTNIEWTDETWNPVIGCTHVSAGCDNCYAVAMTHRIASAHPHGDYPGLTVLNGKGEMQFNGTVRLREDRLQEPMGWRTPRKVLVNSMSDLFHENVPFHFIRRVYDVMLATPRHAYQVLTKRAWRAAEFFRSPQKPEISLLGLIPNLWIGASVENQEAADGRINELMSVPAAVRFLSCEPMLGPISLDAASDEWWQSDGIDWVICGGEIGSRRRPMNLDWARSLRDQCQRNGIPFFMNQADKVIPIPDDLNIREYPGG